MALCRSGYWWKTQQKSSDCSHNEWIPALLELSSENQILQLIVHPSEPIYETVDDEEKMIKFSMHSYKRCTRILGSSHNNKSRKATSVNSTASKSIPRYQLALQKGYVLKGGKLKVGFEDKNSQQAFFERINTYIKSDCVDQRRTRLEKFNLSKGNLSDDEARKREGRGAKLNYDEIANFMTDNEVYDNKTTGAVKIRIIPTDLSQRLNISGIYLLEIRGFDVMLLDYINLAIQNQWPFKSIRSFGYNDSKLYILTGSRCPGGRGLLIFFGDHGELLISQLLDLMRKVAHETEAETENTCPSSAVDTQTSNNLSSEVYDAKVFDKNLTQPDAPDPHSTPITRSASPVSEYPTLESGSSVQFFRHHSTVETPLSTQREKENESKGDEHSTTKEDDNTDDASESTSLVVLQTRNQSSTNYDSNLFDNEAVNNGSVFNTDGLSPNEMMQKPKTSPIEKSPHIHTDKGQSLKKCLHNFFGRNNEKQVSSNMLAPKTDNRANGRNRSSIDVSPFTFEAASHQEYSSRLSQSVSSQTFTKYCPPKHSLSNKAVQLTNWRDLPAKNEYNSREVLFPSSVHSSPQSVGNRDIDYQGSDIVNFVVDLQNPAKQESSTSDAEVMALTTFNDGSRMQTKASPRLSSNIIASTVF